MNRSTKRLLSGFGLLVVIAVLSVMATTSVFAFHGGFTQSSATNAGPLNNGGAVVPNSITPGTSTTYTANYTFTYASAPPGAVFSAGATGAFPQTTSSPGTTIGTMYQQWRNTALTDRWFYLYAGNQNVQGAAAQQSAVSASNPSFAFYFYTRERGQTTFNSAQAFGSSPAGFATTTPNIGAFVTAQTGTSGLILLDTAGNHPIATVIGMTATVGSVPAGTSTPGTRQAASFAGNVRWGVAQEAWPQGSATLLQAVESVPLTATNNPTAGQIAPGGTAGATTFADPWNQPVTLTLANSAPVQSSITNLGTVAAPGARQINTSYTVQQVVTDANADINNASLIFVFTSGSQGPSPGQAAGQWFQVAYANGDTFSTTTQTDAVVFTTGTCQYQSSFESLRTSTATAAGCSAITTNYLTSFSASAAQTAGANTSETITYTLTFNSNGRGTMSVFGRGEDFHGATSGNVLVGAITVS